MDEKTEVKKDDSKEVNLRDQVELLKRENCALLMEREKLSAKHSGVTELIAPPLRDGVFPD